MDECLWSPPVPPSKDDWPIWPDVGKFAFLARAAKGPYGPRMQPGEDDSSKYWGIYIDNFMETELLHLDRLSDFQEPTQWQESVRAAYDAHEVLRSNEKAVSRLPEVERLGSLLDGEFGAASTPGIFDLRLVSLTMWMLRSDRPSQKVLQILGGRWVRKMLHRRETLCIFPILLGVCVRRGPFGGSPGGRVRDD